MRLARIDQTTQVKLVNHQVCCWLNARLDTTHWDIANPLIRFAKSMFSPCCSCWGSGGANSPSTALVLDCGGAAKQRQSSVSGARSHLLFGLPISSIFWAHTDLGLSQTSAPRRRHPTPFSLCCLRLTVMMVHSSLQFYKIYYFQYFCFARQEKSHFFQGR